MSGFILEGSTKTPEIRFNGDEGILEISGRSIPEISSEFYQPIIDWVKAYGQSPKEETKVVARFEYFNTSSSKSILDIFKALEDIHKSGKSKVSIDWIYTEDDESMEEAGEEYRILLSVPFNIKCEADNS
ncbi:MAG: DUF1987 domain-containing protein [Flavobacteriales bacterium]|nr:DUF1987 domain-containing protein [Flavobacteriales bacterium]